MGIAAVPLIILGTSSQVVRFIAINRGIDPRRSVQAVVAETRDTDDFAVVIAQPASKILFTSSTGTITASPPRSFRA